MFFGYRLVEKGLVTMQQVLEALDTQREEMMPLGRIARREGRLNDDQVYEVLNRQKNERRPFGSIAIELGYLTKQDVNELLEIQNSEPSLGDILVKMGAIDKDVMEKEFSEYHKPKM